MNNSSSFFTSNKTPWIASILLVFCFYYAQPFSLTWGAKISGQAIVSRAVELTASSHVSKKRLFGMGMLFIFGFFTLLQTKNRFRINQPVGWLLIFYFSWIYLSLTWSMETMVTFRRIGQCTILWFTAIALAGRYNLKQLASIAIIFGTIVLIFGLGNDIRRNMFHPNSAIWRFGGIMHSIPMGWTLSLVSISTLFLSFHEKRDKQKYFLWALLTIALVFLYLTRSRMAAASTIFVLAAYWFKVSSGYRRIIVIFLSFFALCFSYIMLGQSAVDIGEDIATLGRGEEAKSDISTLTGRTPLWKECMNWVYERPLLGYGYNTFINAQTTPIIKQNVGWAASSTHSGYIDSLTGLGFIGLLTLASMLLLALMRAFNLSWTIPEYYYATFIILWMIYNCFLEANLLTMPQFPTLFCMTMLAKMNFVKDEEWIAY